ncbi:hypothetical protein CYMTET_30566, partial [Cymbomonas tetramitiformis]
EEDALSNKRYKLMHTSVLREYLAAEMFVPDLPFQLSVERLFDDFVFMSFFAGNDFLPHMPTLEIREGALDLLLTLYRGLLPAMGGPLCSGSEANLERVEMLMRAVAEHEDAIFEKRRHFEESSRREALRKCRAASHAARARRRAAASTLQAGAGTKGEGEDSEPCPGGSTLGQVAFGACDDAPIPLEPGEVAMVADVAVEEGALSEQAPDRGMAAEEELKMRLAENMEEKSQALYENCKDEVMLGQDGWKERYYSSKLSWSGDELCESKNQMVYKYVEGLCWVLKYYLEGCPSWGWYYPYHYAPFASDFEGCSKFEIQFEMGQPFQPLSQLMAVLPAASSQALPAPYAALMTDPGSPIAHFYPKDFELDLNGKRFAWQAVALLPFIDADQLLEAIARIEGALGVDEAQRNTQHSERLFISSSHALAPSLHVLCSEAQSSSEREGAPGMRAIDPLLSSNMNGSMMAISKDQRPLEAAEGVEERPQMASSRALCVFYADPAFRVVPPDLLLGTILPKPLLTEKDIPKRRTLWHEEPYSRKKARRGKRGKDQHLKSNEGANDEEDTDAGCLSCWLGAMNVVADKGREGEREMDAHKLGCVVS